MNLYTGKEELTQGVTLLEASAGTGKTYSITELFLRLIDEREIAADRILVVTYTRAATAELKNRISSRIRKEIKDLREKQSEDTQKINRLEAAEQSLDRAVISTIHGFCQRVLSGNAFESGVEMGLNLVPDARSILESLIADYLERLFHDLDASTYQYLVEAGLTEENLLEISLQWTSEMRLEPEVDSFEPYLKACEEWQLQAKTFAEHWQNESDAAITVLSDAISKKKLDARSYQARYTSSHRQKMDEWARSLSGELSLEDSWVAYFTASKLETKTKTDWEIPQLFQELEKLVEDGQNKHTLSALPLAFAVREIRQKLRCELARQGVCTYDDLLRVLAEALNGPNGEDLADAIRARFDVALIDEFQDTDGLQWQIFAKLFQRDDKQLYLIGDPKQAIYGFRGANIRVYLKAKEAPDEARRFTMATNWRSDRPLVQALNQAMGYRGIFGEDAIEYIQVDTSEEHAETGYCCDIEDLPLQLRYFDAGLLEPTKLGQGITKGSVEEPLALATAEDIVAFLKTNPKIINKNKEIPAGPGDLAVLVDTNNQARKIQRALLDRGVPAAIASSGSVYASQAALDLMIWLEALCALNERSIAALMMTDLLARPNGNQMTWSRWTAAAIVEAREAGDSQLGKSHEELEKLRNALGIQAKFIEHHQFLRAFYHLLDGQRVVERTLGRLGGERRMTDLLQLAELLHHERGRGLFELTAYLRQRIAKSDEISGDPDAPDLLHLESDAKAVRISTIHKSKGLEYPFVWVPFLCSSKDVISKHRGIVAPDGETGRVLDLNRDGEARANREEMAQNEYKLERMRLLYVALTRAKHRLTICFGNVISGKQKVFAESPLAPLFWGTNENRFQTANELAKNCDDPRSVIEDFAKQHSQFVQLKNLAVGESRYEFESEEKAELNSKVFNRTHWEHTFRITSYSDLVPHDSLNKDSENIKENDEREFETLQRDEGVFEGLPKGTVFGSVVHKTFEVIDFSMFLEKLANTSESQKHLKTALSQACIEEGLALSQRQQSTILNAFLTILKTPLGGQVGSMSLSALALKDRLNELNFDLAVAQEQICTGSGLAAAMEGEDPEFSKYLRILEKQIGHQQFTGYLTGSIDLVFRYQGRCYIADYKTNTLPNYEQTSLQTSMAEAHYYLQAHLYAVALHRFHTHRLGATYDYDRDFGGIYYLFLRGMNGTAGRGVFEMRPSRTVIERLDEYLRSGR